jgi:hypothetical protein
MRTRLVLSVAAAFAAGSTLFGLSAGASDAPDCKCPPPQKQVENALLKASIGEWEVTWSLNRPDGQKMSGKGTSKLALAVGGTAVVEDYAGMAGFHGHAVLKESADGKTLTNWWFDSMAAEPIRFTGALTETSAVVTGDAPGLGQMRIEWKKVEGGIDFASTVGGKPFLTQQYRRSK